MGINEKMKTICDNIRLRTGGTEPLTLDEIAEAILTIGGNVDMAEWVHKSIGATFPPAQLPASDALDGYDIDALSATSDDIHEYIDDVVSGKKTVSKEILGKDASGKYDIARYIYANREHIAWVRENYPKMYAWKNVTQGSTVVVPPKANVIVGQRYSHSGQKFSATSTVSSIVLPLPSGISKATIVFSGMTGSTGYSPYGGTVNNVFPSQITSSSPWSNGATTLTVPNGTLTISGINFIVIPITSNGAAGQYDGATITLNGQVIEWEIATISTITASQESTTIVPGNDETIYSASVSPRIGDAMYTTPYIGTAKGAVTAVSATNRSRTVGGVEYVRYAEGDIEPTVIYTDSDDERNGNNTITSGGNTYNRYPLGDLGENRAKLTPIFIYANEHGVPKALDPVGSHEPKICSVIAARFLRDLASDKQAGNPLYKYIRENCMVIVIPVANPFGYNLNVSGDTPAYAWTADGYYNYNGCNINRNYDTPGWDVMTDSATLKGGYPGSQNETQFIMNTMVESGAAVAMSLHGLGSWEGYCAHQGQSPDGSDYDRDKLAKVAALLLETYGYTLRYYDLNADGTPKPSANLPATTSKSPSYITQSGAYGGIVEFNDDDARISGWHREMNSNVMNNAYAQMLNLLAMWLSDYLESQ